MTVLLLSVSIRATDAARPTRSPVAAAAAAAAVEALTLRRRIRQRYASDELREPGPVGAERVSRPAVLPLPRLVPLRPSK